jgi:DNA-binding protein Fis
MAEVVSIHNEIVKLKQLGLLDVEVNDQSRIDEILKSMMHSFKEFRCKLKGKDVCSLFELVSVAADSMMEPKFGMMVGETSFS